MPEGTGSSSACRAALNAVSVQCSIFKEQTPFWTLPLRSAYKAVHVRKNKASITFMHKSSFNCQEATNSRSSMISTWKTIFKVLKCRTSCFLLPWQHSLRKQGEVPEAQSSPVQSRPQTSPNFLRNSWIPAKLLLHNHKRDRKHY